jgi:hypothetical protein
MLWFSWVVAHGITVAVSCLCEMSEEGCDVSMKHIRVFY